MNSNTTETEMVAVMKPADKEDITKERRRLRSRRVNHTKNEKAAIKKKIKSCREVTFQGKL